MAKVSTSGTRRRQSDSTFTCSLAELGALYRAGYEAGYVAGKVAAAQESRAACATISGPPQATVMLPVRAPSSRHMLLGLPCENCGAFFASDDPHCPCCKRPRSSAMAAQALQATG